MNMVESNIVRIFGIDYIYFSIIFLAIWIIILVRKNYMNALGWGLIGVLAWFILEYILWYSILKVRYYSGPLDPILFFLWLSFSEGIIQFSYIFIMFEKRNLKELLFWTAFLILGWAFIACCSQWIQVDDRTIVIYRNMNLSNQRLGELIMVGVNIIISIFLLVKKKARIEDILYIFLVGILVEFALEFTLAVSAIRQDWTLESTIRNTLIEFNLGIVLIYLIYYQIRLRRYPNVDKSMSYKDLGKIQTDFNFVSSLFNCTGINELNKKTLEKYLVLNSKSKIESDLQYLKEKYQLVPKSPECIEYILEHSK